MSIQDHSRSSVLESEQNLAQNGDSRSFKVTCFRVSGKAIRDKIILHNNSWPHFLRCRRCSVRKPWKSTFSITPLSFDASSPRNPATHIPYIARNYSHCATSLLLIVWVYLRWNFRSGLYFETRGRSRSPNIGCIVGYCAINFLL